jgi:hypothetical protein
MSFETFDEILKLGKLGLNPEKLAAYQVLCLSEHIFSGGSPNELMEASDSINLGNLRYSVVEMLCDSASLR